MIAKSLRTQRLGVYLIIHNPSENGRISGFYLIINDQSILQRKK